MLYFDYTATTPIDEEVLETYIRVEKNFFGNSTSLHKLGQMSNYMYEKASEEIREVLKTPEHNIIFTANATEANNLGIYGIVLKQESGKIITTKIEHPSVYKVFKDLESRGYEVVFLDINQDGIIDLEELKKHLSKDVILVSVMWVNNIIGSIQPINEIIKLVQEYPKTKLHVDCVQGVGKIVPDFNFSDIDLITISGHKLYGPKGIGALIYRKHIDLQRRLYGSEAQFGIKPGTISVGLAAALCKTLKKYLPLTEEHYQYVRELNQYLRKGLSKLDYIVLNSGENASPYVISISLNNLNGETLVHFLESHDIYVSTGSACSSKLKKPERTIYCLTNDVKRARSSIRISLSHLTTKKEIDKLLEVLEKAKNV
jgi:cysteine desulfurase